jgi:hypothetical protein
MQIAGADKPGVVLAIVGNPSFASDVIGGGGAGEI